MALSVEQALALAPDPSSASAGRKLGTPGAWRGLGRGDAALWGECQGSALYQVRVDLSDLATRCSCPSRKFPCKHAIGLLVLAATDPAAFAEGEPPEWVATWLARHQATAERASAPADEVTQDTTGVAARRKQAGAKREDQRERRILAGIDALDRWLDDLIRNGLAATEGQPATFWEAQARRLVDAQAPGLAARVRRLAAIPHASPDWTARLLDELGRLALLTHANRRLDALDPALRDDVRGLIGWTLDADEVAKRGEVVRDDWLVVGQRVTIEDRLRQQRSWLVGARGARAALVLQFAHGASPFKEAIIPGTRFEANLACWPSAWPQRALLGQRHGPPTPIAAAPPGADTIAAFLDHWASALARQPWLDRDLAILHKIAPTRADGGGWLARDATGATLPLAGGDHWHLLALSGGHPLTLAAEWDGATLTPLGAYADGAWQVLGDD